MPLFQFRIPVTDGARKRFAIIAAPDYVFAVMKAQWFCEGSCWRVTATI